MSSVQFPTCCHVKTNGVFCGSPALHGQRYCYFHHQWRKIRPRLAPGAQSGLVLPLLEDANAIQIALQRVMQALINNQLDPKRAGLLLYALQTASSNLKQTKFETYKLDEQIRDGCYVNPDRADYDPEPCEEQSPAVAVDEDLESAEELAEAAPDVMSDVVPHPAPGSASTPPQASSGKAVTDKMRAAPPPRKHPEPEHDAELTDDELIQAIRSLAGLK